MAHRYTDNYEYIRKTVRLKQTLSWIYRIIETDEEKADMRLENYYEILNDSVRDDIVGLYFNYADSICM